MAEGFDPHRFGRRFRGDRTSGRATQEVQPPHSRKMEWVHEIQRAFRIHGGPQRDRRRAFGNSDFHQALALSSMLFQRMVFRCRVLRNRRPQSGPREERMLHHPSHPPLGLLEFWLNLGELNPRRGHFVSGSSSDTRELIYGATLGFAAASTIGSGDSFPSPPAGPPGVLLMAR